MSKARAITPPLSAPPAGPGEVPRAAALLLEPTTAPPIYKWYSGASMGLAFRQRIGGLRMQVGRRRAGGGWAATGGRNAVEGAWLLPPL